MSDFLLGFAAGVAVLLWSLAVAFLAWRRSVIKKIGSGESILITGIRLVPSAHAEVIAQRMRGLAVDSTIFRAALSNTNRKLAKANSTIRRLRAELRDRGMRND